MITSGVYFAGARRISRWIMNDTTSKPDESEVETVEFYVPATFQFSPEPGRIERLIVGVFRQRGGLEARFVEEEPTREFYAPAVYQFSTEQGRIERFLKRVFAERGKQEFKTVPEEFMDMFYLPASSTGLFRRREKGKRPPMRPASEVIAEEAPK